MSFEEALYNQLMALPSWTIRQAKLASIIQTTSGTPAIVKRIEERVRDKYSIPQTAVIDWSNPPASIDWQGLLAFIEQLLAVLLPLLSGL